MLSISITHSELSPEASDVSDVEDDSDVADDSEDVDDSEVVDDSDDADDSADVDAESDDELLSLPPPHAVNEAIIATANPRAKIFLFIFYVSSFFALLTSFYNKPKALSCLQFISLNFIGQITQPLQSPRYSCFSERR